ncbi:hypothetical protein C8F04DRAFT_1400727 [Mycena alexandri]|uniref:Uncharacterized protein n=1 Tax=Mycena alexandri TaxID=1745969 RepID=A0AAD6SE36_9AGAR|nr:hypothetical protein C8F04DRAFT_1400727 [Mycena alexandri]
MLLGQSGTVFVASLDVPSPARLHTHSVAFSGGLSNLTPSSPYATFPLLLSLHCLQASLQNPAPVTMTSHAGSFFSFSRDFTILGGNFVNNNITTINAASPSYSDIRIIPLGDLDLRHEIGLDHQRVVVSVIIGHEVVFNGCTPPGSARIQRLSLCIRVLEWIIAVKKREAIWHPNILQWCGVARAPGIQSITGH